MSFVEATLQRSAEALDSALHRVDIDVETKRENDASPGKSGAAASVIRSVHKDIHAQFPVVSPRRLRSSVKLLSDLTLDGLDPVSGLLLCDVSMRLAFILQGKAMKQIGESVQDLEQDSLYFKDILSSWLSRTLYLVQSAPVRLGRLAMAIIGGRNGGTTQDRLGRAKTYLLRPTFLISVMFPHVHSADVADRRRGGLTINNEVNVQPRQAQLLSGSAILALTQGPFALISREARVKGDKLDEIGKQRARAIGTLASIDLFEREPTTIREVNMTTSRLLETIQNAISTNGPKDKSGSGDARDVLQSLSETIRVFDSFEEDHVRLKDIYGKPSAGVRYWPLVLGSFVFGRGLYKYANSRSNEIAQFIRDFEATVDGFWKGWVVEPVKGILQTIRHDSDSLSIMGKESLRSDLESLERMTDEFGREVLKMSPDEALVAAKRVREGDLTSVLKVYETELKSPIKSALLGSLVRTLLIQIQKTKVDVELAMNGIDKLLKSQELTFGFIGVAPSLIIVMLLGTSIINYLRSSPSNGGKRSRKQAIVYSLWKISHRVTKSSKSREKGDMDQDDLASYGSLLLDLDKLYQNLRPLLRSDRALCRAFEKDIRHLGSPELDNEDRIKGADRLRSFWLPVILGTL